MVQPQPLTLKTLLFFAAMALSACSSSGWQRQGATRADFDRDAYECERDVRQSVRAGGRLARAGYFERCLHAHGWNDDAGERGFSIAVP